MGIANGLQSLVDVVDQLEAEGHAPSSVVSRAGCDGVGGNLSVEFPLIDASSLEDDVDLTVTDIEVESGTVALDIAVRVGDGAGARAIDVEAFGTERDALSAVPGSDHAERETPAYKKPELLREVYETYETFPEMTEALGVDVTPKTVRNHMVEHGIHDPEINKTPGGDRTDAGDDFGGRESADDESATGEPADVSGADADDPREESREDSSERSSVEATEVTDRAGATDSDGAGADVGSVDGDGTLNAASADASGTVDEEVVPDGLGLPEHVTVRDVKESVKSGDTLHEVRRHLDLEREQVKEILDALNLLELVYGRVSSRARDATEITDEDIESRIRLASATEAL